MTLRELLEETEIVAIVGNVETTVTGIAYDSRRVKPGDVFFGLSGLEQDGQAFVRQAFTAGAAAAVVERDIHPPEERPLVRVDESRTALAQASARFYSHPSRELKVVGVTGTNGKTTTTWLVDSILRAAGMSTGLMGTTGYRFGDELRKAPFTTPEAPELQGMLREMVGRGIGAVSLELSSHALVQKRCYALECDAVVFTNLSHDHLDYHGSVDAYLDAKLRLFDGRNQPRPHKATQAVINADDAVHARVVDAARHGHMSVTTYGASPAADVRIENLRAEPGGLHVELREGAWHGELAMPILGRYNAWNAAAAFAATRALGVEHDVIVRGLETPTVVPGRLERVEAGQAFGVVVDYAHTPDALEGALAAVREHAAGRVLLVFGCGGDRDRAKRPLMGRMAAGLADRAWVTNDNPRREDPGAIAREIVAGAPAGTLEVELDRRRAIAAAIDEARAGDVVLIAGKGHETTQTFADRVEPFDDREEATKHLRGRSGA